MGLTCDTRSALLFRATPLLLAACFSVVGGCKDIEPIKRELKIRFAQILRHKHEPFVPRDGVTIRSCSLYRAANPNSPVIRELPAEASVHLLGKVGDWFRVRTRDATEGFVKQEMVGGQDIIQRIQELKRSIESIPPQAEGITKARANFRLQPGREHKVVEVLPQGKKFEVYERVVTVRHTHQEPMARQLDAPEKTASDTPSGDATSEDFKKDVWYKVKIEDGRVGYLYTHNMVLKPPDDIARMVPFMRMVAWQAISVTDDPDLGAKNNYLVAYTPIGKDPGCDYTKLYLMTWSSRLKRRVISWQLRLAGILPLSTYRYKGRPGFSVRYLHPSKKDKLVRADFAAVRGGIKKVNEEEVPNPSLIH